MRPKSAIMLEIAIALWFFILGACIGSFLNVVIYRLPAGQSLVSPGSRCPRCGHEIRPKDNIPVLGWLLLRGRCRDCGVGISPRYPAVEGLIACLFVLLYLVDVRRVAEHGAPSDDLFLWLKRTDLLVRYGYHLWLATLAVAIALIDWDGNPVPKSLAAALMGVGIAVPLLLPPELHPQLTEPLPEEATRLASLANLALGALAGGILGWLTTFKRHLSASWLLLLACGIFLGPLATAWIALISCGFRLLFLLVPSRYRPPPSSGVALALSIQLLALQGVASANPFAVTLQDWLPLAATAAAALAVTYVIERHLTPSTPPPEPKNFPSDA